MPTLRQSSSFRQTDEPMNADELSRSSHTMTANAHPSIVRPAHGQTDDPYVQHVELYGIVPNDERGLAAREPKAICSQFIYIHTQLIVDYGRYLSVRDKQNSGKNSMNSKYVKPMRVGRKQIITTM